MIKPACLLSIIFLLAACAAPASLEASGGSTGGNDGGADGTGPLTSYWDWQLSEPFNFSREVQVIDLDPDSVSASRVASYNSAGTKTICYVSIGTIENYRDDVSDFPPEVVGKTYGDWPDEKFLDVRQLDVLVPLMTARFQKCRDMGFSAIEPDNMDVHDNDSGFPITSDNIVTYVLRLASVAHDLGLEFAQKNVGDLTASLVNDLDFVITESCYQDGWCGDVTAYTTAGKDILDAEYNDRPINFSTACGYAADNSIKMILKDRDLTAELKTCE